MTDYLLDELTGIESRIRKLKEEASDNEVIAELNNLLTPVVVLLDEHAHDKQPDFDNFACQVLQETRSRLEDLTGPQTLRSGEVPRARDTMPCMMEFKDLDISQ